MAMATFQQALACRNVSAVSMCLH